MAKVNQLFKAWSITLSLCGPLGRPAVYLAVIKMYRDDQCRLFPLSIVFLISPIEDA